MEGRRHLVFDSTFECVRVSPSLPVISKLCDLLADHVIRPFSLLASLLDDLKACQEIFTSVHSITRKGCSGLQLSSPAVHCSRATS